MILDCDLSSLEYRVAAELSQDQLMIQEIRDGLDIHSANAINLFGDVKYRQEAKILTFRMIYGGSAYAFFMDPVMPNFSQKKWDNIVNSFYDKYSTLKRWQDSNFQLVNKQGYYDSFTGRKYYFKPERGKDGSKSYSRPSVCNYIVQGTSTGDLVPLAMVQLHTWLRKNEFTSVKIINQVHDSIVIDCPKEYVEIVGHKAIDIFEKLPQSIKSYWGYDWTVPLTGETKFGMDWSDMQKLK